MNGLNYKGTWDASDISDPPTDDVGDYYYISVDGNHNLDGITDWTQGDWAISTGTFWQKIDNSTLVPSVFGRRGAITSDTNDYTWEQIDKSNSTLGGISDVNLSSAPSDEDVLAWDTDTSEWIPMAITIDSNSITSTELANSSVDSDSIIDYSITAPDIATSAVTYAKLDIGPQEIPIDKISNLETTLSAKLSISGGTMTGDINMHDNSINSVGTVDNVDISALNGTVAINISDIADLDATKQEVINSSTDLTVRSISTATQAAIILEPYGASASQTAEIRFKELTGNENNYVGLKAPNLIDSNIVWILPATDGANTQVLQTDGNGVLTWVNNGVSENDSVNSSHIQDNAITATEIATSAVSSSEILDNSITVTDLYFASTDGIDIPQLATNPATIGASAGQTYYNTTSNNIMYFDGTSWVEVESGGNSGYLMADGSVPMTDQLQVVDGEWSNLGIKFAGADTGIYRRTDGNLSIKIGGGDGVQISNSGLKVGDGLAVDPGYAFMSGGGSAGMYKTSNDLGFATVNTERVRIDSAGNVGIGTSASNEKLTIEGAVSLDELASAPSATAGYGKLYVRNDSKLYFKDSSGTETDLTAPSGASELDGLSDVAYDSGNNNLFLGYPANGVATGDYNTFLGLTAGDSITTSNNNTGVGYAALTDNTSGDDNSAFGYFAMNKYQGNNSVAMGYMALGSATGSGGYNVAIGKYALDFNYDGSSNVAVGYQALRFNISGDKNTALGGDALYANTSGSYNTAVGENCLYANKSGYSNVSVGYETLDANTTGDNNVAIGRASLGLNVSSSDNVGVGVWANYSLESGLGQNTTVGTYAMRYNETGAYNVALGYHALHSTEGSSQTGNTAIGYQAGNSITTGDYNIVIGYNADVASPSADYQLSIGNKIYGDLSTGNIGIGTSNPNYKLHVNGSAAGISWINTSDERLKKAVTPVVNALDKILALEGITFKWRSEEYPEKEFDDKTHYGFIAQEVEKVAPEIVSTDNEGFKSVEYANITSILVEAFKEYYQKVEENLRMFKAMQGLFDENTSAIADLKHRMSQLEAEYRAVKEENLGMRNYLCSKFSDAPFCIE